MTTRTFRMKFEPMTIEHLGLRLYSTLPPVLSELVSNAYDAESPKVEITFPTSPITPASEVIVRDYGHGMNDDALQDEYLPIGRNRRGVDSSHVRSKTGARNVTGRKGLGKLSAFGIAEEMEIRSINAGHAWTLRLNYDEMKIWARTKPGREYEPTVVTARTGPTTEPDGVEIRLRKLRRANGIAENVVRHGLAHRLNIIGPTFKVFINGAEIRPGDRTRRSDCVAGLSWDVADTPVREFLSTGDKVRGWVGFVAGASQIGRGIDIFANGKAAELGSFFDYSTTHAQFARAHIVGEVHADFLDSADDLISTARNSVVWEAPAAQALQSWGQKVLAWAFDEWLKCRRREKEEEITKAAGFDKWLATRTAGEQRVAKKMLSILVDDDSLDPSSARPLLEIIKGSVETVAFRELVDTIEEQPANAATLLQLFDEWRVIEAREHLQLADGRTAAISQLEKFIAEGALEVQELQPLLRDNPWLLNPDWTEVDVEQTYSELLKKGCKEPKDLPEGDRRLDIIAVTQGTRHMTVVELKRPEKILSRRDLEQIERYVDWANTHLRGTGAASLLTVEGLLVVGRMTKDRSVGEKVARLRKDGIRVETLPALHKASRARYKEVEKRLEGLAPEYTRTARQKRERENTPIATTGQARKRRHPKKGKSRGQK